MKRAIVTGGTGYVGCHLVNALARKSVETIVAVRKSTPGDAVEYVRSRGATVCEVDYRRDADLAGSFASSDVWFHLIGSDSFEHRHRDVTAQLVTLAQQGGIDRVIFLTALGTSPKAKNTYHRTKWEAEREISGSGISGAIIRPSLIVGHCVGPRNSKLVDRYIGMIRGKGKADVLGDGRNLIQPVDVRDVVKCMISAAEKVVSNVTVHDIGGREQVQFRAFVGRLANVLGRSDARIVSFPLGIAALIALILENFQEKPLLTREHVALMREDNVCAVDSIESQFGFVPRTLDESLQTYSKKED